MSRRIAKVAKTVPVGMTGVDMVQLAIDAMITSQATARREGGTPIGETNIFLVAETEFDDGTG